MFMWTSKLIIIIIIIIITIIIIIIITIIIIIIIIIIQWGGAVQIDKKHKKIKWHVTNDNIVSNTTTCKQCIKIHSKFQLQQKENQFPLVFAVFSHLISRIRSRD